MEPIIRVRDMCKTFTTDEGTVTAADHISFEIEKGDIYGIIGLSGAGKSTLVRCLNMLERPDSGSVVVDGKEMTALSFRKLREERKGMGMIFQHFNLLMQRTVLDNVCFPLKIAGMSKTEARKKAMECLETVGLSEKARAYPAQLSGGQKQRVAIARVLASNPKIILSDEATSALDPQTTKSILELLQKINREMGITIVIITHEMAVIQQICHHVAVLEKGKMVESGTVEEIFRHPKTDAARKLIISSGPQTIREMYGRRAVRITFGKQSSYEPVIGNVTIKFGAPVNILYANTRDLGGMAVGEMILQLPDDKKVQENMIAYLKERGLGVDELEGYVNHE